jgi:hypothetical protein
MTIGRGQARVYDYIEDFIKRKGRPPRPVDLQNHFMEHPSNLQKKINRLIAGGYLSKDYRPTGTLELTRRPWSDADLEKLHELASNGKMSARELAAHFPGKTRNSIIGKMSREGLALPNSGRKLRTRKAKRPGVYRGQKPVQRPREGWDHRTKPVPFSDEPVRHKDHPPTPFIDLEPTQCRFCVEDLHTPVTYYMECCGVEVMDRHGGPLKSSYCELHYEASTRSRYA